MAGGHTWTAEGHHPNQCVPCLLARIDGLTWALGQAVARVRELEGKQ